MTERYSDGLAKNPSLPGHLNSKQFQTAPDEDDFKDEPFEPLSDDEYADMERRHNEREASAYRQRQQVGQLKREYHGNQRRAANPPKEVHPIVKAQRFAKAMHSLSRKAGGR